jgi:CPA1 family monovalent cation:H+ antiporter
MELSPIELVLGLLCVAVALGYVARRIGVAYPILLLLGGLVLGYLPGLPPIELDPDLVFLCCCRRSCSGPATRRRSATSRPTRPIALAVASAHHAGGGLVALAIMPFLLPAAAFAGAIVAPPDAVAATRSSAGSGCHPGGHDPRGRKPVNDATAIILYRFRVAAADRAVLGGRGRAAFVYVGAGGIPAVSSSGSW